MHPEAKKKALSENGRDKTEMGIEAKGTDQSLRNQVLGQQVMDLWLMTTFFLSWISSSGCPQTSQIIWNPPHSLLPHLCYPAPGSPPDAKAWAPTATRLLSVSAQITLLLQAEVHSKGFKASETRFEPALVSVPVCPEASTPSGAWLLLW